MKIPRRVDRLPEWNTWDMANVEQVCNSDLSTPDGAAAIWRATGASYSLNVAIELHDKTETNRVNTDERITGTAKDWFKDFVHSWVDKDASLGCTTLENDCDVPKECSDLILRNSLYNDYNARRKVV